MSARDPNRPLPPADDASQRSAPPAAEPRHDGMPGQPLDAASLPPDVPTPEVAAASAAGVPEELITAGLAPVSDPHAGPHGDAALPRAAGSARLFFGLLGGPVVWAVQLQAGYSLGTMNCGDRDRLLMHLVSLVALLVTAAAAWSAWRAWRALGELWPEDSAGPPGRARFMAAIGTITSVGFFLVILAQAVPSFAFPICR